MTFPGADTIKGGIMGDDFFLRSAGATLCAGLVDVDVDVGSCGANWAGIVSTGEASGVCVECDDVERLG
jgi:hypothetical protein